MSTYKTRAAALVGGLRRHVLRPPEPGPRSRQLGQVLPIFAVMAVVLLGGAALLTDVAWWWTMEQRMQRAADAGALAGAIYLPGNQNLAFSAAISEAAKNGFADGVNGATVTPRRDPGDPRKLIVDVDSPVNTNFARVFAINSVPVAVTGAGSYVLPVPMGSPQNYYGVGFLRVPALQSQDRDTGWDSSSAFVSGGEWSRPDRAYTTNSEYTFEDDNNQKQDWYNFGESGEISSDPSVVIDGLEIRLRRTSLRGSGTATDCRVSVRVSLDSGANWSDPLVTDPLADSGATYYVGSSSGTTGTWISTAEWGSRAWTRADFGNSAFRVRLAWNDDTTGCHIDRGVRVDDIEVRVSYHLLVPGPPVEVDVNAPDGSGRLDPQGFWGALQSQGAPNIQGDAYMTYYDTRTSRLNDEDYAPEAYYQYGIEFPAGASAGEVWLFDPGFCHVDSDKGTGEYYTLGGSNGSNGFNLVSTFYELWDTNNTPYDTTDDGDANGLPNYSSGDAYRRTKWYDTVLDANNSQTSATPCDNLPWHNDWVQIANGLSGGRTYRLHTYSTDPTAPADQRQTTALNAFAIWAGASGGTPRVYGLGAMEAYIRLPGGRATEFYLAQIDEEHAGKTLVISLWDPGDTGQLAADLQILRPELTGYEVETFSWAAMRNSGNASNCGPDDEFGDFPQDNRDQTDVTFVRTNEGGRSNFNGCWLQIEIPLPNTYTAPKPTWEDPDVEGGWWKIRYNMSGSTSSYSTDLTTWEVELRGNPVHLVQE